MKNGTFRSTLTTVVVALTLMLVTGAVQAAEIVTDESGTTARAILGLKLGATLYDVQFVLTSPAQLYGLPVPDFDVVGQENADIANEAVVTALNTVPAVTTVGPSATPSDEFLIRYALETGPGQPDFEAVAGKYQNIWETTAKNPQDPDEEAVYADFTPSPLSTVPDLAGESQSDAEAAIVDTGLTVGEATEQFSEDMPDGVVINQIPTNGVKSTNDPY